MRKAKILLVEDNEGDIILTTEAFEEADLSTNLIVVRNGKEALNSLSLEGRTSYVNLPDLILLDINLPLLNGHEVLHLIKQNEFTKHIPVIILTTSSSTNDINATYDNHANCFITKPADINEFFDVINSLCKFWFQIAKLPIEK